MKRFFYILLITFTFSGSLLAQYNPTFSQYLLNGMAINPAFAGSREALSTSILYRDQWLGFNGAPKTMTFSTHTPLKSLSSALGLQIFSDKIGVSSHTSISMNYAYRVRFKKNHRTLAIGLGSGVDMYRANLDKVSVITPGDEVFENQVYKSTRPNISAGIYYYSNKLFAGISAPAILHYGYDVYTSSPDSSVTAPVNLFFLVGYTFKLNNDIKFRPSILHKSYPHLDSQTDFNLSLIVFDQLNMGLSVRSGESLVWIIEYQIIPNQLRIGYAHDFVTSRLNKYSHGTNEIMLRYELVFKTNATSTKFF